MYVENDDYELVSDNRILNYNHPNVTGIPQPLDWWVGCNLLLTNSFADAVTRLDILKESMHV